MDVRAWCGAARRWWQKRFPPQPLGRRGEVLAVRYLRRLGYTILAHGARGGLGELDVVAVDGRTIVFVEVKTRRSLAAGHPAESVDARKQRQLTRLALAYLRRHELLECAYRFDIVAIVWPLGEPPRLRHIRNAFPPTGQYQMFS